MTCPFSIMTPGLMEDPHSAYARLRDEPPVVWSPLDGTWIVHRWAETAAIAADRRFEVVELAEVVKTIASRSGKDTSALNAVLAAFLPLLNPPRHTSMRRHLSAFMAERPVDGFAPAIEAIADDLLGALPLDAPIDIVSRYADPLPPMFIAHFLGLAPGLVLDFVQETQDLGRVFDRGCSPRYYERVDGILQKMRNPILQAVKERRANLGSDGLSLLIARATAEEPLSDDVLTDHVILLILTGAESTSALIGRAIDSMLQNGVDLQRLRQDNVFARRVVEEALRHDGPVQHVARIAREDVVVGDVTIRKGERVQILFGAANRDPLAFNDPNEFRPERRLPRHLAFGAGLHYCLGAGIARLETTIALQAIAAYSPSFEAGTPRLWRDRQTLRRLDHLVVRLHPRMEKNVI